MPSVPPPSSGLLVTFAVLNLLFALACGCISGFSSSLVVKFASVRPGEIEQGYDEGMAQFIDMQMNQVHSDMDRQHLKQMQEIFKKPEVRRAVIDGMVRVPQSPGFGQLKTGSLIQVAGMVVLLISSILLLMRLGAGRIGTVLGCLGVIIGSIMSALATRAMAPEITAIAQDVHRAIVAQAGLSADDQTQVREFFDALPGMLAGAGSLWAMFMSFWPAVAACVVGFSAGIRRACTRPQV